MRISGRINSSTLKSVMSFRSVLARCVLLAGTDVNSGLLSSSLNPHKLMVDARACLGSLMSIWAKAFPNVSLWTARIGRGCRQPALQRLFRLGAKGARALQINGTGAVLLTEELLGEP